MNQKQETKPLPWSCVYPNRAVYEGEEVEAFQNSLANRIKVHEKDIERMCNKNYQGFIESVSELLKVKADAGKIKVRHHTTPSLHTALLLTVRKLPS